MDLGATRDGPEPVMVADLGATRDGPEPVMVAVKAASAVRFGAARDGQEPVKVVGKPAVNLGATRDAPQVSFGGSRGPAVTGGRGPGGSLLAATTDSLPHSRGEAAEVPERLGRYLVIQQLGAGGMGVVYKAYDPDLDRKVAVKLLRGQGTEHARARLLREAQAMAKLSHPGVVPVFDVGTVDGQVFVAMDFIAGETLQAWMKPVKPWREVLEIFVQAGLGLAAAHAAGLIHRDFKPDNVLLGRDPATGRMRAQVADFGLARRDDDAGAEEIEETAVMLSRSSMLDHGLTRVGAIVGTPMYMSPEQHVGAPVDPRTDQFSFCVALFEALYGYRPFDGETVELLARAANLPRRKPPPTGTDVPGWLHRLCLRGLQPDREARFPGMDALLDEVERGRSRGRGRWLVVGAAMIAAAAASAVLLARGEPPPLCAGGPERMIGVWDEEVQARAEQAFTATNKAYAAVAWSHARDEVDRYGAAWSAMHRDSCEATMVRGEQSAELMDLRSSCLADRLQDLQALTALYAKADATVVKQALVAAQALPPLDACADAAALREGGAAPPTELAEAVLAAQAKLAEARTLRVAGKSKDSLALANVALGEAEALGFAPLVARARLTVGSAQVSVGEHEPAVATLTRAVAAKLATRDDDGLLDGLLELGEVLGYHLGRDEEAAPWLTLADAVLTRMGEPQRELARLLLVRATVDIAAQRFVDAEARLRRSTALVEQLGADDSRLTSHLNALGGVYLRTGKYAEAQAQFERSVALAEASNGPNHPDVAFPLNNLALSFERQARYDDAIATLRRALGVIEGTAGADHPNAGLLRQNIGGMLRLAGDLPGARAELDAAVKIMEAKLGPEHPVLGHALTLSGDIARDQGDRTRARAEYRRSDDLRRKVLGEDHPERSLSLLGLGRLALDEGDPTSAAASLEKALALMATTQPDPIDQAEVRFYLATALPATERARARSLATQARVDFAAAGVRAAHHVVEVDEWLAAHPG